MQAEFSIVIANAGEIAASESHPVYVSIDDEGPLEVEAIEPLEGGETTSFAFSRELEPGLHKALASVVDAEAELDVDARTAEISLEVLEHSLIEDGLTHVRIKASNGGELAAESVAISAYWQIRLSGDAEAGNDMTSGSNETAVIIDKLEPGEDAEVAVPLQIPSGSYDVEIAAYTDTLEATSDDNAAQTTVDVEYVQLAMSVEAVRHLGYANTGEGLVEIDLRVTNNGVAPGTDLTVGLDCLGVEPADCSQMVNSDLIPAGDIAEITLSLIVPQGSTEAMAYAGALEDSYRWGHGNVAEFVIEVPELPATRLSLEVETSVRDEYWSDGTANVDIAFSLRNEGYAEFEAPQPISFVCLREEQSVESCGGEVTVSLLDGFGPETTESLMIRMPMGITLLEAEYGAEDAARFEVEVPERILGVARDVWECFSDRPGEGAKNEGCGGWFPETIVKWDQSKPIKMWATGDEEYVAVLEETLEELSPLLNLEFQRVETEDEADLKAYVGVSVEEAKAVDFYCEHSLGCARSWQGSPDITVGAIIGVWDYYSAHLDEIGLLDDRIKRTIVHEALHALVPIIHRKDPLSILNITGSVRMFEMNPTDEALIRLHSNLLVKPGMTMGEVEDLIFFEDELMDPHPPDDMETTPIELVRQAYTAFHEAEAVGFRIHGSWVGCGHEFGTADLQFASLASGAANLVRFKDRNSNVFIISDSIGKQATEYWKSTDGTWQTVYSSDIFNNTAWRSGFSNPFTMFSSILLLADPEKIKISEPEPGKLRLDVYLEKTLVNVRWSDAEILTANLTIDFESHEILSYFMSWRFNPHSQDSCTSYSSKATGGIYGIEIKIPAVIQRDSSILRWLRQQDS